MILGPDGEPIEVEPIPLAPPYDPYEAAAERLVLWQYAGRYHNSNEDDE